MKMKLLGVAAAVAFLSVVSTAHSATNADFGVLYSGGVYTDFSVPGAALTRAFGINNAGQIVGEYRVGNATFYGFLYSHGTYTTLNFPGGSQSHAYGINDRGQIVGSTNNIGAWVYDIGSGVYTSLAPPAGNAFRINDVGHIVGDTGLGFSQVQGYLYSGGTYTILSYPGATETTANGINNRDQIVGYGNGPGPGSIRNFLYSDGTFTPLAPPPQDAYATAFDINNRGQIVFLGNLSDESFLYSNGTYTTLDMFAYGLNDRGQIVGYGPLPPPSVPLPTALPLFATGLAGLGLLGWRRKKKTAAG